MLARCAVRESLLHLIRTPLIRSFAVFELFLWIQTHKEPRQTRISTKFEGKSSRIFFFELNGFDCIYVHFIKSLRQSMKVSNLICYKDNQIEPHTKNKIAV